MKVLGIELETICKKRQEESGRIESCRGPFKTDPLWTAEPRPISETLDLLATSLGRYTKQRPRSSLNHLPHAEFARKHDLSRTHDRATIRPGLRLVQTGRAVVRPPLA